MYVERLLRHSEKGTMSSEGRQRLSGKSSVRGMVVLLSFLYFVLYKILSHITRWYRQIYRYRFCKLVKRNIGKMC